MTSMARARAGNLEAPFAAMQTTPFGAMGVRIEEEALAELVFLPATREVIRPYTRLANTLAADAWQQIAAFVADPDFVFDLPLAQRGTEFQRRVWNAISAIPRGRTRGYGDIARTLGSAPRAVGQACGSNFFPLVIPCHRVVAASGLGGFAHHSAGFHLRVKRWLLEQELRENAAAMLL